MPTQVGYLARAEGWAARALSPAAGAASFLKAAEVSCTHRTRAPMRLRLRPRSPRWPRANQQIAEELVRSVRTVETYVYRAMQKRGVEHRHEL